MKVSVAWIFDHIDARRDSVNVPNLVDQLNRTTAEIESFQKITVDLKSFSLARADTVTSNVVLYSQEWNKTVELPLRPDAKVNAWYMIKKTDEGYAWAHASDFHCAKGSLLPSLICDEKDYDGGWKKWFEAEDWILEVDNKSITHRPDMWSHRGFAREIAALLNVPLKPLQKLLADNSIKQSGKQGSDDGGVTASIESSMCKRFAFVTLSGVQVVPSSLWMAHRLLRVDSKPIDAIVDVTNYVMLDLSQPLHAFDGAAIVTKTLVPRQAKKGESLTLLDGQKVELVPDDLVITDGKKPISLAGVMGGVDSAITAATTTVIIESACFDAVTIRRTALRHKTRTDASARFEKSLDPNQNTQAILRLLSLLDCIQVKAAAGEIVSLGEPAHENSIVIEHAFIEKLLGAKLDHSFVETALKKLEFGVTQQNGVYTITVPTFRGTKDVTIKQDIVEEVGRFFGYTNIPIEFALMRLASHDMTPVTRLSKIKAHLAYGLQMREVYLYSFFDESALRQLQWEPRKAVEIKNPVSENWRRLVTTLVPQLIMAVNHNSSTHDTLSFFEWARVWNGDTLEEKKVLSGIFFERKKKIDFYEAKAGLESLFALIGLKVVWHKAVALEEQPWFELHQTAVLMCGAVKVGVAGKIDTRFSHTVIDQGDAFVFELDGDFLLQYKPEIIQYRPLSKYPEVVRDVSILLDRGQTVDAVIEMIARADNRIKLVTLVDFFEKDEWVDQRSLTFRYIMQDETKTMTGQEVDGIVSAVQDTLQKMGATIR